MTVRHTDVERLALLGWRLYPASRSSKAACIKAPGESATFDLDKLEAWTRQFPNCNWRMSVRVELMVPNATLLNVVLGSPQFG